MTVSGVALSASEIAAVPMLPPTNVLNPSSNDFTDQRCRSRLAVRTGDGNDRRGKKLRSKLNFADHRLTQSSRLHQWLGIDRNAGAYNNQVLIPECAFAVSAGFNRNPGVKQSGYLLAQLVL